MKTVGLIIVIFLGGIYQALAQDIVSLKSGHDLKAHVLQINPKDVVLSPDSSSDTMNIPKTDIIKIRYFNGVIIYFSDVELPQMTEGPISDSMYFKGETDATRMYRGYKAAATGTLITSLFIPWGLVPAIACSNTPPSVDNLGYMDQKLMQNPSYYKGYTDKAFKIKKRKVWKNFAIGSGITVGYYMLMIAIVSAMMVE